jgi:hypothetical protein
MSKNVNLTSVLKNAYFLAKIVDGQIVEVDGDHPTPQGVTKALAIYKAIGIYDPKAVYKMIQVSEIPEN